MPTTSTERSHPSVQWINIPKVDRRRLGKLHRAFPVLDERDLADCLPPQQRPKFVNRGAYWFCVLLFPRYVREEHAIVTEEVDIFVLDHTLITIHTNTIPVLSEMHTTTGSGAPRERPAHLLLELLERLLDYCQPILVHLQNDIEEQESLVREHLEEIDVIRASLLRRNVVVFRRSFGPNAHVFEHLHRALGATAMRDVAFGFDRMLDKANEINFLLGDYLSAVSDIHETQQALVNYRTNRVTTTLTVIAVLTFPITMIAAIFAMGARGTPLLKHPDAFWIFIGAFAFLALAMLSYFKDRKWF